MSDQPEIARRLGIGVRQRLRQRLRSGRQRLLLDAWFPHLPISLAVGVLGVMLLRRATSGGLFEYVSVVQFMAASRGAMHAAIAGAPNALLGLFLIVMAFGLLMRSRLAWVTALLCATASFLLILLVWPPGHTGLLTYNAFVLACLLIAARVFNRSSLASATLFAVISIVALLAYAVLGTFLLGADFAPPIHDLVTALYFAIVTMGTVGYGDIAPKTPEARMFVVSVIFLGITVFATSLSALLMPLINRRMEALLAAKERHVPHSNHYVIVSDSALARNTAQELKTRSQPVVFILARPPSPGFTEEHVVVGDASELDVLRRAQTEEAKAILALGADDSENAFVVMAAKELSNRVKTVAVVNDARNMARIKRVHPDLVIAPQVLGGELLAMALSGEAMQSEQLMKQLLHFES